MEIFLKFDIKTLCIILYVVIAGIVTTFVIKHNPLLCKGIFYVIVPTLIIVFIFDEHIREYGIFLRNNYLGIIYTCACLLVWFLILYFLTYTGVMKGKPSLNVNNPSLITFFLKSHLLSLMVFIFYTEFLYRGFMLFGLEKKFGENAIYLSVIPYVFSHLQKPKWEIPGALIMGLYWNYVNLETRSIFWSGLMHYLINVLLIYFAYKNDKKNI